MRILSKLNTKNESQPRYLHEATATTSAANNAVNSSTDSSNSSTPRSYHSIPELTVRDEHLLPSFQMHQFYVNRSMVDDDETPELPPPPLSPNLSSRSSFTDDVSSQQSSTSVSPSVSPLYIRSSSSRRRRNPSRNSSHSESIFNSGSVSETEMLRDLFYRDINFESEKESILHNLNQLQHLQNKFIKMKVFVYKDAKSQDSGFKQVNEDGSVREYQPGDEIVGFATISNNSQQPLSFEMFATFLSGETTVVRGVGNKFKHTFLKMIDLESFLLFEKEEIDEDGFIKGLPSKKVLLPGRSYKVPFKFVLPNFLLDNACESELPHHLRLPPSFGISKDSSGWLGSVPDRGFVCHNLSTLHSSTSHSVAGSTNVSVDPELFMKGGDGIFTNDLCPSGLAVSYGIKSVLIGASKIVSKSPSPFCIINDSTHQLRVIPHYLEETPSSLLPFIKSKDDFFSLENLRIRFENEIVRLENIIDALRRCSKSKELSSSDEDCPSRKIMAVSKEKQLELSNLQRKLASNSSQDQLSIQRYQKRKVELKLEEIKSVQKKYLNQHLKSTDSQICSIVNFLNRASSYAILAEVSSMSKTNPTLFELEKLNRSFINLYSKSSFLKISCDEGVNFMLDYKTPLTYKLEEQKTIWGMFAEKKKLLKLDLGHSGSHRLDQSSIKRIDLDLLFVSIKNQYMASHDEFIKPPKIKVGNISICAITAESKNPLPINLRVDMFFNATNENVDLNDANTLVESSRKMFSFSSHNKSGVIPELRNYKNRLVRISKELDLLNADRPKSDQVTISSNIVKSLNALLNLKYKDVKCDGELEMKSYGLNNTNWEVSQEKTATESKLIYKNTLSILVDINYNVKETLVPSFQTCLLARLYALKIDLELEDGDLPGAKGYGKRKAVVYVPIEIK